MDQTRIKKFFKQIKYLNATKKEKEEKLVIKFVKIIHNISYLNISKLENKRLFLKYVDIYEKIYIFKIMIEKYIIYESKIYNK